MRLSFAHLCDRLSRLTFSGPEEGHWVTIGAEEGEDGEKHGGVPVFIKGDRIAKGPAKMVGHSPEHPTGGVPSPQPVLAPAIPQQPAPQPAPAQPAAPAHPGTPTPQQVQQSKELVNRLGRWDTQHPTHSTINYLRSATWTPTVLQEWAGAPAHDIPNLVQQGILEPAGGNLYRLGLPAHVYLNEVQSSLPGSPATPQQAPAQQAAASKPLAAAKPKADKGATKAKGKLKKIKKYTGTITFGYGAAIDKQRVEDALRALGLQEKDLAQVVALAIPDASLFPKVKLYANSGGGIPVLYFSAENGNSHVQRHLYVNQGGDGKKYLVLKNDEFFLDKDLQGEGAGTTFLYNQVKNASKLGVKELYTYGAKSSDMNGYYTWPRLGYDAPLNGYHKAKMPASLKNAKMISDLMATQEGRDWWKKYGSGTSYTFDLTPDSFNHQVLDKYVAEKFG